MAGIHATTKSDRRQASVLFADISGFTALSQKMDPEDMAATMDACFRVLEKVIVERGGVVDKFIGDCVMALFGAPKSLEHAPRQAVNAAIAIRSAIQRFNVDQALPSPLDCHIGVNTGLVVAGDIGGDLRRDYTVMGPTVNLAARLEGKAANGQIFVGPATYRHVSQEFRFRKLAPLELKGIDEPVQAWEVDCEEEYLRDARATDRALALHSEAVGRDGETAALRLALAALADGRGGIVAVEGVNGIGKSRLLAEALRGPVRERVRVLEGRSLSTGKSLSFHPFVDLVESWAGVDPRDGEAAAVSTLEAATAALLGRGSDDTFPYLARLTGRRPGARHETELASVQGEALEALLYRAMRTLLSTLAAERPLALVFDDLHWADQSSIALLLSLVSLADSHPVLFLLAFRPDYEETSGRVLRAMLADARSYRLALSLTPLAERETRILLRNLLGSAEFPEQVAELIQTKATGNPLYVEEVVRTLFDADALEWRGGRLAATPALAGVEIHGTIEEVIMGRVDRLDAATRSVLEVAAVVGRSFHKRVLARVMEGAPALDDALALLVDKHFLVVASGAKGGERRRARPEDEEFAFDNPFTQEKLYDTLLKRTRRDLHARCTSAIETLFADRLADHYAALAWHSTRGEMYEKARDYLQKAGEMAASSAASAEALDFFREAYRVFVLAHGNEGHAEERATFERHIAMALLASGRLAESIQHFNAALELLGERVPDTDLRIRLKFARDLPAVLLRLYTGTLGRKGRNDDRTRRLFELMYNRCRAQNIVDAERGFFDNIAAIRHVSHLDPEHVENATGIFASAGTFFAFAGLSFGVSRRFLAIAERLASTGSTADRFQFETMSFVLRWHEGDWSPERDVDSELLEQGLRAGLFWNADVYLGMVCERDIHQGRYDQASVEIAKLGELYAEWGYEFARSNELAMRAFLLLEQRQLGEAREAIERYHDLRSEDTLHVLALASRAKIETLLGDLDAAGASLAAARGILGRAKVMPPFYASALRLAHLRLATALAERESERGSIASSTLRAARGAARAAIASAARIARDRTESLRLAARIEALAGNARGARALWRRALDEGTRLGALPETARIFTDVGTALAGEGATAAFEDATAEQWLAKAREAFARLDDAWDLARVERASAKPGV